ncbi:MAG TPA: hypothetical protein VGG03_12245 [Thermoanaerobaculia bacterium]|jgi:hypothetical protein
MQRATVLLLLLGTLGCAAGNRAVYTPTGAPLDYAGQGPVAVGVKDSRPEVVSGDRKETYIGFQRSLYGIPFAVQTKSGKPFAQDLAAMIVSGLRAKGVQAQSVPLSPFESREETLAALQASSAPRLLLFDITEWYADTYVVPTLHYDLTLTVLDGQGRELGKSAAIGEDDIGGKQRPQRRTIPAATLDIIQELLSDRAVVAALSADARPRGIGAQRCTVDQILKMRESGLSEEQIKAACGEG